MPNRKLPEDFIKEITALFPNSKIELMHYIKSSAPITIKCLYCGEIITKVSAASFRVSNQICVTCKDGQRIKENMKARVFDELSKNDSQIQLVKWNGTKQKAELFCMRCKSYIERYPCHIISNPQHCYSCMTLPQQTALTIEEAQKRIDDITDSKDYEILEYTIFSTPALVRHKICGFIFKRKIPDFAKSRGCPRCQKKISKLEAAVEKFLIENQIKYDFQKRFKNFNNGKSSFDFAVYDDKSQLSLIEVQGEQHYFEVSIFSSTLEQQLERDAAKKDYCSENNIRLIEIPYYDINNLDKYFSFLKGSTTIENVETTLVE